MSVGDFSIWATNPGVQAVGGDFDGDGRNDIALTGGNAGGSLWKTVPVAFSKGDGSFRVTNVSVGDFSIWATNPGVFAVSGY